MKLLGIDFGLKKVGLALSDESGTLAFPKDVVLNNDTLLDRIVELVSEESVEGIVFGYSTDFKGEENSIMEDIYRFKKGLEERLSLPIHFEEEFFTTAEAKRYHEVNEAVDATAAMLILQSFLNKQTPEEEQLSA